ncbi:MAG: alpha-amylase [Candidatus Hydrogenedentes bacterium]|nr:alpha-amylase [Candidatus Hydrogenedentota bacterium]
MALSILTDVFRYLAFHYCVEEQPGAMAAFRASSRAEHPQGVTAQTLSEVTTAYPPLQCIRGGATAAEFLAGGEARWSHADASALELVMIRLCNLNPAAGAYRGLYNDDDLLAQRHYTSTYTHLEKYFEALPPVSASGLPLVQTLRKPIEDYPDSLLDQLAFVTREWAALLPAYLREWLIFVSDVIAEETVMRGFGPGAVEAMQFGVAGRGLYSPEEEVEAFSQDRDWMPNLVLMAKSTYVWLDQLSRRFARPVNRLDEIPDEALDELARWGFTGLWLIGLWERSESSRTIKVHTGNPEAAASAYSLFDYTIAEDLGGEGAYQRLAGRAWQRGIRLASDMVPNHMGIYSRWVIEQPDWFIQSAHPPFPSYQFTGPNLSLDPSVGLYIEDGYWNRTDAAVVFKRVDHYTGATRFIYHGNDGTNMPWNDTAQLNFLIPAVREAVIQTILLVARKFPIIRFDAAMTLAKKHYQRLWFPMPGDAGAIPSRAEHSMTKETFDAVFPVEFWREVVDRVAAEAPDTLLLAEAFWLMEGYFVRTLGMHRVYNSAFMNMLKLEENSKYRQTIKNVLEFSPEVLQRFVNFMNNPDEDTAEAQFGRGDKYFGVAMSMVTMPGLPMFGHGQIEGFREKYGMEYRRAYWGEEADQDLVSRHEREIFPLIRHRYIFSGSRHFALYDFVTPEGWVNENVFVYSNRSGSARALVIYNNAYGSVRGCIHTSTAINRGPAETPDLIRKSLADALNLNLDETSYYIYRDTRTGLEYLEYAPRIARDGLHIELGGYQYAVFMDWRQIEDRDCSWGRLHGYLDGRGVPSVAQAYCEMQLWSILQPFERLLNSATLQGIYATGLENATWQLLKLELTPFLEAVLAHVGGQSRAVPVLRCIRRDLRSLNTFRDRFLKRDHYKEVINYVNRALPQEAGIGDATFWRVPVHVALLRHLGWLSPAAPANVWEVQENTGAWMHEWFMVSYIETAFSRQMRDRGDPKTEALLVRCAIAYSGHLLRFQNEVWAPLLDQIAWDPDVQTVLGVNPYGGRYWFNKERFEHFLYALYFTLVLESLRNGAVTEDKLCLCLEDIATLLQAADGAGYDLEVFLDSLK